MILQFIRWRAIQLLPYFAAHIAAIAAHIAAVAAYIAAVAAYIAAVAAHIAAAGFFTTFSIFTITELRRMFVTDSTTKFSPTIPKIR